MKHDYNPSLGELRVSFRHRFREYLLENTLHGVPYFIDASRPKWERITWLMLTVASFAATIGIIVTIWGRFQTDPTLSGLDTTTQHIKIDFPQVFVCFNWPRLNHSSLDKEDEGIYSKLYNWQWGEHIHVHNSRTAHGAKDDFRDTLQRMVPDCGVVFKSCSFRGVELSCGKNLTRVLTPAGACCKFNASQPLLMTDRPWEFAFVPTIYPFRLYILRKFETVPNRDDESFVMIYAPSTLKINLLITYTAADLRYLTRSQRRCHYENEGPSFYDCELDCLSREIVRRCGCSPWFFATGGRKECPLSRYSCVHRNRTSRCRCTVYCDQTYYALYHVSEDSEHGGRCKVEITRWPNARYKREVRFGYLDLLVSFGGIAGLFLGYSLLTSVELGYYFSLRTYCGAVLVSSRSRHNITTVRVIDAKTPREVKFQLDVKPMYYDYVD